jgi:hypothetical protein
MSISRFKSVGVQRYSESKREWELVSEMHPSHVLNCLKLDLAEAARMRWTNDQILENELFGAYFSALLEAHLKTLDY